MSRSVATNTTFMTVASVGQKIISSIYFFIVAHYLPVEDVGKYVAALSFTTIFVVFVDLGFTSVLVREASRWKDKLQEFLSTVLAIKILFGIVTYGVMVAAAFLLGYPGLTRQLIFIAGITMLFDSLHATIYGALRTQGNLLYESIGLTSSQFITFILGSIALYFHLPFFTLILAFTIPSFLNVCYSATILYKKHGIRLVPKFQKEHFKTLGLIAVPFALSSIFARIYSYIDSAVLLPSLAGDEATGFYSIPYKITYAFQFIPLSLTAALYPRMSEFFVSNKKRLEEILEESLKYLFLVAVPIVIGIYFLGDEIIGFYNNKYIPSIPALKILIISLLFSFLSFPLSTLLNAGNRQVTQTVLVACTMVLNIISNLFLIPKLGIEGAAFSALLGNIFLVIVSYYFSTKVVALRHGHLLASFARVAVAGGVMAVVLFFLERYTNTLLGFGWVGFVTVAVYASFLLLTGALQWSDVKEVTSILKRK